MNQQRQRVLIIGAGPSGLSLLRAFECQRSQWQGRLELVCVEKQSQWGGQWNYIAKEKLDKHGMPIPSTNQYLWTNAPKQCFEYPDYPFEQHFNGKSMPSYLPRQYLREYFTSRFESSCQIAKYIKFDTIAYNIAFIEEENKFFVNIESLITKNKTTELFDYVIVASGHYSLPNVPNVEGLKQFQGKLIHSVQVTDYLDYKNERVLVVGTGLSAQDAVLQCYKYGAKSITVTYRSKPMPQKFPEGIQQLPLLNKVSGKTVTFKNGQQRQFDTIIMCTGYVHNFTFLSESLRLKNSSKLWANDLYMGVALVENPRLMYVGMQAQYFSFMMFDIQSHFVRNVILGKTNLPSKEEMKQNNIEWGKKQTQIDTAYDVIHFMGNYLKSLIELASYKGYQIDKVIQLYIQLQKHKQQNILTFRDNIYQSSVTGQWSVMKDQTWLEAGAKFQNGNEDPQLADSIAKEQQKLNENNFMNNQQKLIQIPSVAIV